MKWLNPIFVLLLLIALGLTIIVSLLGLWVCMAFESPLAIEEFDVPYFAQVARNVARGEGFTTDVILPTSLHRFGPIANQPDLYYPPLYVIALALAMKLTSASDLTIIMCSSFFYIVSIVMLFVMAYKVFDIKVAALSCFFFMTNSTVLLQAVGGTDETFDMLLFIILILCIYTWKPKDLFRIFAPGIVLGLLYLTRYRAILFLPVVCWCIYRTSLKNKRKNVLLCLGSFAVVIFPWLLRNLIVAGNPFFSYAWISQIFNGSIDNLLTASGGWIYGEMGGFAGLVNRFNEALKQLIFSPRDFLPLLFFVAILYRFKDERFERIRKMVYLLILIVIGQQMIYQYGGPYLIFLPFIIMVAVAYFFYLVEKAAGFGQRGRVMAVAVFIAINIIPLLNLYCTLPTWASNTNKEALEFLTRRVNGEKPLVSDAAHLICWFEDRKTIMLPLDIEGWNTLKNNLDKKPAYLQSGICEYHSSMPFEIIEKAENGFIDTRLGLDSGVAWDHNFLFY